MARVLEINAVYNKGSTGVLMEHIGEVLTKDGFQVYYATPDAPLTDKTYRIGNKFDHKVHAGLCRIIGVQGYFSNIATMYLIRWIDQIKPDVIHIHNLHSNYINYILLFAYIQKRQIKTVVTLHDCWFFTGKCFHFLYDDCMKWKQHCGCCPRLHKEQNSMFFDLSSKVLADKEKWIGYNPNVRIVAVSEWLAHMAKESILKEREISVIRNGIDLNVFYPCNVDCIEKDIPKGAFVILTMANKWFAPESANIRKEILSRLKRDMYIIVAGCWNGQTDSDPRVMCLKRLGAQQLAQYYSLASVFMNLTKVDSFPTVNMEAISCGTPVVTFDSGGAKESVLEGKTGYIVKYGDVETLLNRIDEIKNKGKKAYTKQCVLMAKELFDKEKCFTKYLYLIKEMLEHNK